MTYEALKGITIIELVEEKYEGRLHIPETAKKQPNTGTVLSSSRDDLKAGDKVFFARLSGDYIESAGKITMFVPNDRVYAKVKP